MGLTLRPIMFLGDGSVSDLDSMEREVIQYEVVGLPPKQNVLIGKKDGHWRILRVRNDVPGTWSGTYLTAEAALAALKAEQSP